MNRILRLAREIDDHWAGDLLGMISLFAGGYGLLLIGYGMGFE